MEVVFQQHHFHFHIVENVFSEMSSEVCGSLTAVMGPIFPLLSPADRNHTETRQPAFNKHAGFCWGYLGFAGGWRQRWGMLVHHPGNRGGAGAEEANEGGGGFVGWGHAEGGGGG